MLSRPEKIKSVWSHVLTRVIIPFKNIVLIIKKSLRNFKI